VKRRRLVAFLLAAVFVFPFVRAALWRPFAVVGEAPRDGYHRYGGVVHIHTTASDGGGTPEEVITAARTAGLHYIAITDHNNMDAAGAAGYHDGLLVMVGTEISTQNGHLLALGLRTPTFQFSGDLDDAFEDVRDLGGFAFAAHPVSPRTDFAWTAWERPGPWGLELLNGDSQWREAGVWRLVKTAALYGVNPRYALLSSLNEPAAALRRWDGMLARRDVPALVGADAHSRLPLTKKKGVRFPSYEAILGLARNHVLLEAPLSGDAAADGRTIAEALARGRNYIGLDAIAPANGLSFVATYGTVQATMGDTLTIPRGRTVTLRVSGQMPAEAKVTLLRDGRTVKEERGGLSFSDAGAGVYRVEVGLPGWSVPWVITNPIVVADADTEAARRRAEVWMSEPAPPAARTPIESFAGPSSTFVPEFDPASSVVLADVPAAPPEPSALQLDFKLGAPDAEHPYTWCALVNRQRRSLAGSQGLVFSIRGDGVYRLWVQVRDENPASADAGEEWWFASVKTSPEWRTVALPFTRFRSINPRTDGRLDLDKVVGLVFVIDKGAMKPGSSGRISFAGLGVY
jgi:hypothetical protein